MPPEKTSKKPTDEKKKKEKNLKKNQMNSISLPPDHPLRDPDAKLSNKKRKKLLQAAKSFHNQIKNPQLDEDEESVD